MDNEQMRELIALAKRYGKSVRIYTNVVTVGRKNIRRDGSEYERVLEAIRA